MTDLSPAAQSVLDATYQEMDYAPRRHAQWAAAAALRAVAKQSTFADVALNKTIEVVPIDILHAIAYELEAL